MDILNKDQFSLQAMAVNINPRTMICDQEFRYYEPSTREARVSIPNFTVGQLDPLDIVTPLHLCTIVSSNRNVSIETTGEDSMLAVVD